jgi:hypothetical protein
MDQDLASRPAPERLQRLLAKGVTKDERSPPLVELSKPFTQSMEVRNAEAEWSVLTKDSTICKGVGRIEVNKIFLAGFRQKHCKVLANYRCG